MEILFTANKVLSFLIILLWVYCNYYFLQVAHDYGGPRREFFRLILAEIKEKYFDKGLRELLADDYYVVGVIMGRKQISSCVIELTFQTVLSTVP